MDAAEVNFKLSDLYSPTFARTKRILIAMLNFGRYRQKKLLAFERINAERMELAEKQNTIEDGLLSVQEELLNTKSAISSEKPQVDELKKMKQIMLDKIRVLNETQANSSLNIDYIKEHNENLKKRISKCQDQKKDLEERKSRLKLRILDDPDASLQELDALRILCEKEELALLDSERRKKEATTHLDNIHVIYKRMKKCLGQLHEILQEMEKNSSEKENIKEYKSKLQEMDNEVRELIDARGHTEMKIRGYSDNIKRLSQQNEQSFTRQKVERDRLNKQKLEREQRNAMVSKKIREIELNIAMLESEDATNYKAHQRFVNEAHTKLNQLLRQVRWYHENIMKGMEAAM